MTIADANRPCPEPLTNQVARDLFGKLNLGCSAEDVEIVAAVLAQAQREAVAQATHILKCGHPANAQVGDEHGHASCQWCTEVAQARVDLLIEAHRVLGTGTDNFRRWLDARKFAGERDLAAIAERKRLELERKGAGQ